MIVMRLGAILMFVGVAPVATGTQFARTCAKGALGVSVHAYTSTTRVQLGTLHTLCSWQ
jgi:hypothetical protein